MELLARHGKVWEKQHQSTSESPDLHTIFLIEILRSLDTGMTFYFGLRGRFCQNLAKMSVITAKMNTAMATGPPLR